MMRNVTTTHDPTATDAPGTCAGRPGDAPQTRRILLQTVGTGRRPDPARPSDAGNPVWEALAWIVRDQRPDILIQFCTWKTLRETVPLFEACLGADRPVVMRRFVGATEVSDDCTECRDEGMEEDVAALFGAYVSIIDLVHSQHPGAELAADFTSGTKPMSCALALAATARRSSHLLYATGPRDASGRVTATTGSTSLSPGGILADRHLGELGRLFDQGEYAAVASQAGDLLPSLPTGTSAAERAWSLQLMAQALAAWDRFAWKKFAAEILPANRWHKVAPRLHAAGWNIARIEQQRLLVDRCRKDPMSPERLVDLLCNVDRCMHRSRYDDAVARLYRLLEYIAQVRFGRLTGRVFGGGKTPTKDVPPVQVRILAPEWFTRRRANVTFKTVHLGLDDAFRVLEEAGDPVARHFTARCDAPKGYRTGPLGQGLDARNSSLLAHGDVAVEREKAQVLHAEVRDLLRMHLTTAIRPMSAAAHASCGASPGIAAGPAPDAADDHAFEAMVESMTFVRCPWAGVVR